MRSVQLQAALSDYIDLAAAHLHAEIAGGAEVPFELEQRSGRRRAGGPALYCYRPLTAQFITSRMPELERLSGYAEAAERLVAFDGLGRYLAKVGGEIGGKGARAEASAAIAALLGEVFAEQTDFEPEPARVRAAIERLEHAALSSSSEVTLVGRLAGITIASPELPLTRGLTIAQPHALEGLPPEAVEGPPGGHLVVALEVEQDEARAAVDRGREILKDLLRALRLFGDGRVTLGALAWGRVGSGQWTPLALGNGGRPRGMLVVNAEQEDELRAFCNLVSRRAPDGNEIAWALRRFELGCEREDPHEALSDHLLALRGLLEPEGPSSGLLAGRVAALCATPERRLELTDRVLQAQALERAAIAGTGVRHAASDALVADTADHLRALLRDVICGHLDPDLVTLADEILLEADADAELSEEPEAADEALAPSASSDRVRTRPVRAPRAGELTKQIFGDPREAEEILDVFI